MAISSPVSLTGSRFLSVLRPSSLRIWASAAESSLAALIIVRIAAIALVLARLRVIHARLPEVIEGKWTASKESKNSQYLL